MRERDLIKIKYFQRFSTHVRRRIGQKIAESSFSFLLKFSPWSVNDWRFSDFSLVHYFTIIYQSDRDWSAELPYQPGIWHCTRLLVSYIEWLTRRHPYSTSKHEHLSTMFARWLQSLIFYLSYRDCPKDSDCSLGILLDLSCFVIIRDLRGKRREMNEMMEEESVSVSWEKR